ncbi:conserved hypothetical protein [Neospora caninum Liverpool]|uniref:Uncharacterized protein n=1 Tax=Neospora caninum (strain Liverpool) TaxID=572307 RepID=F0VBM1_NEOCL|nr:conserved hypothetical protein [Neospora caninum Liverpool]CBZ51005.1 conserved hypothetical protein [Neospora caninum Liverpool]CEL68310.1 TPA: hypothetical protein BN1204_040800 [Neospora caninum Liverpool]|eukprot:XP_003881038.1 conserved hypothetical protein [Neospora caninum Liverpool]
MQQKKKRSVHHAAAAAESGSAEENAAFLAASSTSDAAQHLLTQPAVEPRMKKKVRRQRETGAEAHAAEPASTASPRAVRRSLGHRRAGATDKSQGHSTNCCIVLTHCPLYLFRDKRHSSTASLLNLDDHRYLLMGRSSSPTADNFAFPFLDKMQAQLRQLHDPVLQRSSELAEAAAVQDRGIAAAIEAAGARASALAEDRRLLLEASMRSDVVHQCLLNLLDSVAVSQLRTGVPHFAGGTNACGEDTPGAESTAAVGGGGKGKPSGKPAQPRDMNLDFLLHTMDGKLLRISPSFRVPRNFKVFKKVATMALSSPTGKLRGSSTARTDKTRRHGWAPAERERTAPEDRASDEDSEADAHPEEEEETLIEVLQPPFWRHLPNNYRPICLSASRHAPKVVLRRLMTELREQTDLVFMISACPYLDAAAIPRCLVRPRTPLLVNGKEESKAPGPALKDGVPGLADFVPEGQQSQGDDACDSTPVAISISNFPMSAAVKCDRLIYELTSFLPSTPPS